jgi:hypothetical protein
VLGGFDPGSSDLDVSAVCARQLDHSTKQEIVCALRHESLPCPARGLELVVYAQPTLRTIGAAPGFELNLNTGARMAFRADYEPGEERHWFAIDRSILAAHGEALFGPPARELFVPPPRAELLELVADTVRWFRDTDAVTGDAVLNACRALRFAVEGVWSSKPAAGAWALEQGESPLVARALAAGAGERLPSSEVHELLEDVKRRVRAAATG